MIEIDSATFEWVESPVYNSGSDEEGQENRSNFFVKKGEDGLVLGGGKAKSAVTRLGHERQSMNHLFSE